MESSYSVTLFQPKFRNLNNRTTPQSQRIRMHLFATSAFVFLAAAVVLITTAWRSRTKSRMKMRSHGGTAITKGASDGRGDLEMLPRMSSEDSDEALT